MGLKMGVNISQIKIELSRIKLLEAQVQRTEQKSQPEQKNQINAEIQNKGQTKVSYTETQNADTKAIQKLKFKEQQILLKLRRRDREVRAHEEAHLLAAGPYARGGPHYEYVRGPDGRLYAVGGEVKIDTSPVPGDPEATLKKARTIKRAALAPANPSPQDRMVALKADKMAMEALMEIQKQQMEKIKQTTQTMKNALQSYQKISSNFGFPAQVSLDLIA